MCGFGPSELKGFGSWNRPLALVLFAILDAVNEKTKIDTQKGCGLIRKVFPWRDQTHSGIYYPMTAHDEQTATAQGNFIDCNEKVKYALRFWSCTFFLSSLALGFLASS